MLKNEMESYVRIGEMGLKYFTYSYLGVGRGVKKCQNNPYVKLMNGPKGLWSTQSLHIAE